MKQIILAAGKGTRLRPLTEDTPKPLVAVDDGKAIVDVTLSASAETDRIREVILVIGYQADVFRSSIRSKCTGIPISFVENERYDSTGPAFSLLQGTEEANGSDFIVQNGDTIYDRSALHEITESDADGIRMAVSRANGYDSDAMKVVTDDGELETVGKTIPVEPDAESAGLVAVRGRSYRDAFRDAIKTLLENDPKMYWHDVLNELKSRGITVETIEVDAESWWEIDTVDDLERARVAARSVIRDE